MLEIGDGPIWVSLDETTDIDGQFIRNTMIGLLHREYFSKLFLSMNEKLFIYIFQTIGKLFNNKIHLLWPFGLILFIIDAVLHMIKQSTLKFYFSKSERYI